MEHEHVVVDRVETGDDVAGARVGRVALAREHDGHAGVVAELDRCLQPTGRSLGTVHGQVAREPRHHHLALRVAEADVVLDDLRTVRGEHESGVEHAPVLDVERREPGEGGRDRPLHDLLHQRVGRHRDRRVRADAAGVGPEVAVAEPLEVLRRRERHAVEAAVAEHEERQLGAGEALLDHHGAARVAERPTGEVLAHAVTGLGERLGDEDALPGGEPIGLDDVEPGQRLEVRERDVLLLRGERRVPGGGDLGPRQQLLHPRLRPLQSRGGRGRSEDRDAATAELVGQAVDEGRLGPDHHEVHRLETLHRVVEGQARGHLGDPRVPGRGEDRVDHRRARQSPREGVLTRAAADDEDLHYAARGRTTVWSRAGPTDTNDTWTPV